MYDLIIGARSIHEHNILDVPNLMAGSGGGAIEFNLGTKTCTLDHFFLVFLVNMLIRLQLLSSKISWVR